MAYYNANLVVKLTREAMGLTQEDLSEDICEPETLSRIEGEYFMVKRDKYRKFMDKMKRIPEKHYAVCIDENGELMDDKAEVERAVKRYDYEAAEKHLKKMKEKADDNYLTRQYIARKEAQIDYRRGLIAEAELIEKLDNALRITMPNYEQYMCKTFPFFEEELLIIMGLGNAYQGMREIDKAIQLYSVVLRSLEAGYIGYPDRITLQVTVCRNLAKAYAEQGRHEEALKEVEFCLKEAVKIDYGHLMAPLLTVKAYNIVELVKKKVFDEEKLKEAEKLLQQAYYIAAAREDDNAMKTIQRYINMR